MPQLAIMFLVKEFQEFLRRSMKSMYVYIFNHSLLTETQLQSNIEKGKLGKLDEYERKVATLEEKFDEAIDTSEKKFDIVDN